MRRVTWNVCTGFNLPIIPDEIFNKINQLNLAFISHSFFSAIRREKLNECDEGMDQEASTDGHGCVDHGLYSPR